MTMTRHVSTAFRRVLLSAFLLLLPLAASAFATGAAPSGMPVQRTSDPAPVNPGAAPVGIVPTKLPEPVTPPSTVPAVFDPVKITLSPVPFPSINRGDQVVREFVVQNDSDKAVNVSIRLRYKFGWNGLAFRSVSTSRQVPAHSVQTVPLFVSSHNKCDGDSIETVNPKIYVDGREIKPHPSVFSAGSIERQLSLPSSFSTSKELAKAVNDELATWTPNLPILKQHTYSKRTDNTAVSATDTIQWPSVPQFYQSKGTIFRKTSDKFTPDAERSLREAVMLGATEIVFVSPGTQWPEWAPQPDFPGQPVIVPRGLGQSVVLDERHLNNPVPSNAVASGPRPPAGFPDEEPVDVDFDPDFKPVPVRSRQRESDLQTVYRNNLPLFTILKNAELYPVNPALVFLSLPCIEVPNLSFAVVILALLAYIIIVGPVNYMYLVKRRKSILLLLLTVPAISLVFVAVVILFVSFFEGWYSRASAVGLTFLDQQESMGYTRAAVNLYAPVPVRRLTFDPSDTVTFPDAKDVDVSLGRDQVATGANKARIPLTYGISRAERHLEQLRISRGAAGALNVVNGLGAPVKILAMRTPDGEYWLPPDGTVQPGASAELKHYAAAMTVSRSDAEKPDYERKDLFLLSSAYLLEINTPGDSPANVPTGGNLARIQFSGSFLRALLQMKNNAGTAFSSKPSRPSALASVLSPGMYIAETDRPLFYSPGCDPFSFRARHLVIGTFTLQESAHEN